MSNVKTFEQSFYIFTTLFLCMKDLLNELLGPSIFLLVLDMLLEYPHQWMNLREIARRVDKNPGSISPVIPTLLERGFIKDCKVGKVSVVYQLNYENEKVRALMVLRNTLKKTSR
jgi:predicted transcriptional regulator